MRNPSENAESAVPASEPVPRASVPWMRLAGAFLAGIPFFCTLPYTVGSWKASPMDSFNWIFHLVFVFLAACSVPSVKESAARSKPDWFALPAVAAAAVVFAAGLFKHIHLIAILGGVGFWWSGIWFLCGWNAAWAVLPAFGALCLGSTSSTFLLCNRLLISPTVALIGKLAAAVVCVAVCMVLILTEFVMKREVFWFLLAAGVILTGTVLSRGGASSAEPFRPDLTVAPDGVQILEIPLSEDAVRFFEGSVAHQYQVSDGGFICSALEVKCGPDIHKIHPASHCLRSSGAEILAESVVMQHLPDGRSLPVTEIRSVVRGTPLLTFVWYTGPDETTGSFFAFRRKWSASKEWRSFQFAVQAPGGSEETARKMLLDLLSKF